jgi:hypothetical protein
MKRTPVQRFWSKFVVDETTGCWLWTAYVHKPSGYGQFWNGERVVYAHVFSFVTFKSALSERVEPDHLCRVRCCVNPNHLEAVTRRINLLRGNTIPARKAAQTHCEHGHEFTPDNIYHAKNGTRQCRACRAEWSVKWAANNRERRRELDRLSYRRRTGENK